MLRCDYTTDNAKNRFRRNACVPAVCVTTWPQIGSGAACTVQLLFRSEQRSRVRALQTIIVKPSDTTCAHCAKTERIFSGWEIGVGSERGAVGRRMLQNS